VPALGDLPVLGNLFRSRAFRDRQTELVVFITPRFVGGVEDKPARDPAAELSAARDKAETLRQRSERSLGRSRFVE
jgi:pilus assembly protein CpaC